MRALIELILELIDLVEGQEAELQTRDEQAAALTERNAWQEQQLNAIARKLDELYTRLATQANTIKQYQEREARIQSEYASTAGYAVGTNREAAEPASCKR